MFFTSNNDSFSLALYKGHHYSHCNDSYRFQKSIHFMTFPKQFGKLKRLGSKGHHLLMTDLYFNRINNDWNSLPYSSDVVNARSINSFKSLTIFLLILDLFLFRYCYCCNYVIDPVYRLCLYSGLYLNHNHTDTVKNEGYKMVFPVAY